MVRDSAAEVRAVQVEVQNQCFDEGRDWKLRPVFTLWFS